MARSIGMRTIPDARSTHPYELQLFVFLGSQFLEVSRRGYDQARLRKFSAVLRRCGRALRARSILYAKEVQQSQTTENDERSANHEHSSYEKERNDVRILAFVTAARD